MPPVDRRASHPGSSGASTGPLEISLTVRRPGGETDVTIVAEPTATLGEVLAAIGQRSRTSDAGSKTLVATCERLGAWLDLDQPIQFAGLAQGDTILVGSFEELRERVGQRDPHPAGTIVLTIHGGPRAGQQVDLAPGAHVVGRDPRAADVAIPADSSLSGRHLEIIVGEEVLVKDLGSRNGSFVGGSALRPHVTVPLEAGALVECGRTAFSWQRSTADAVVRPVGPDGRVVVNRPPRVRRPWSPTPIVMLPPPDEPRRPRIPILASVIPLGLGFLLFHVTENPASLLVSLLGPAIAIASRGEEFFTGSREYKRRAADFRLGLDACERSWRSALAAEAAARRAAAPDAGTLLSVARGRSVEMWVRRATDPDFLDLRVGSADQGAQTPLSLPSSGSATLRAEAVSRFGGLTTVPSVPVIVPLRGWGSVALIGPTDRVDGLGRWLALQAAILHSPVDLKIRAALGPARLGAWGWMKWLPHTSASGPAGGAPTLAIGEAAANDLLAPLLASLDAADGEAGNQVLVFLDGSLGLDPRQVARLVGAAPERGIAVVWLADASEVVPSGVASIVRLDPTVARLELVEVAAGTVVDDASGDGVPVAVADEVARALAPLRDPVEEGTGDSIPRQVSLLETLRTDLHQEALETAWSIAAPAAAIGVSADGPFVVDLAHDGPHMLVGGTTGSGKSELLQTIVASLALAAPPSRTSFLLVDYKGGAAFGECMALPHVVGLVTDLDEHLARRALVSLEAEVKRREAVLAAMGARDLAGAVARDAEGAPARLVIVVDEFATLAREVPEFVAGVVDVAQRGRTLGVHLVLATQRPAGAVTREIWANTNLRIALRVTDPADSTDVIGIPDASRIPRELPGRAFARIGQGSPVEFQAAFIGGPRKRRSTASVLVRPFAFAGIDALAPVRASQPRPAPAPIAPTEPAMTELHAVVEALRETAARLGVARPPSPWLPALPEMLSLDAVAAKPGADTAIIGLLDEPARQRQVPFALDLDRDGGMLVYGSAGSGRTTVLRTIAASLAERSTPEALHLYGLDFGAGGLRPLEALPHCGGIVPGADEERVERLLAMLGGELARRQREFAERGAHNLAEYRVLSAASTPRLVLLLDGYGAFSAAYERANLGGLIDAVQRLAADGRAVGIHVVITADRRGTIPGRLAGVIPGRLVLRLSDETEYGQHAIDKRAYAGISFPPGRGLSEAGHEVQVAVVGEDPSPMGQGAAIALLADRARAAHPELAAPRVGVLPAKVAASSLPASRRAHVAVIGLRDRDLAPAEVALDETSFVVAGPLRSGRSTAIATMVRSLHEASAGETFHLLAPRRSPLATLDVWASADVGVDACDAAIERLAGLPGTEEAGLRFVVIDDGEELLESRAAAILANLVRRGRDGGVRVLAAVELRSALRAYGGWLGELRKDRHGLLLQPGQEMAGELLGATLPRSAGVRPMPPGRGYLVRRGEVELVQVAVADDTGKA